MKFKKGSLVQVKHNRSGNWKGIVTEDFDDEKDEWFSIALAQKEIVEGLKTYWEEGERMPCRKGLCIVELIKESKKNA